MDTNGILDFLHSALRSVGAEVTSPWFYLQLVLAGAGISFAVGATIRARIDLTKLGTGWPSAFRMIVRVLVSYSSTAVFAVLMRAARMAMEAWTWPSRSYLLSVFSKLALAWLGIRVGTVSLGAWRVAALSIIGQLEPTIDVLDSVSIEIGGLRLTPLVLVKFA